MSIRISRNNFVYADRQSEMLKPILVKRIAKKKSQRLGSVIFPWNLELLFVIRSKIILT